MKAKARQRPLGNSPNGLHGNRTTTLGANHEEKEEPLVLA